jgi:hypothetical protein
MWNLSKSPCLIKTLGSSTLRVMSLEGFQTQTITCRRTDFGLGSSLMLIPPYLSLAEEFTPN